VSLAMRDVSGRRKIVILLSEGSSFAAGMSGMLNRRYVPSGSARVMNEARQAKEMTGDFAAFTGGLSLGRVRTTIGVVPH
jgi:hypothetical protein